MSWTTTTGPTLIAALLLTGCVMRPEGEDGERERAEEQVFAKPLAERQIPALPLAPTVDDCVRHALLASPGLEVEYQRWRGALERIPQVSSQLTTAMVGFDVLTGTGQPSLSERTSLLLATAPAFDLVWPEKLAAQGRSALATARAAGFRFDQVRGELRSKVVRAYVELASSVEEQILARDSLRLLASIVAVLEPRISSGVASGAELSRAQVELALADNELLALAAKEPQLRADLNALLGRTDPSTLLVVTMPEPGVLPFAEERVLELLREHNPELKEHGLEVLAARETLAARKLDGLPELSLSASIAKAVQTLGAALTLPFLREAAISGGIAEAEAKIAEADAYWRQMQSDMAADAYKTLAIYRDSGRQVERFRTVIVPAAERAHDLVRASYAVGKAAFTDLALAQRMVVDTKRLALRMKALRLVSQGELERAVAHHGHAAPR